MQLTVLCKSNANNNQQISRFAVAIYCWLDLPQVDLFFILDLFITLKRSEKVISSDEVKGASGESPERSICFTCRNVIKSVNFWHQKHHWHFSLFHVLRARASRKQKIISIKTFTSTVPWLKFIYLCTVQYVVNIVNWQTAKVPLSNASWKDKTMLMPIANYFIDQQML